MRKVEKNNPANELALRAGAASVYLVVGLLIGIVIAATVLALRGEQKSPSFAAMTFGVSAIAALLAASFPGIAMAALAPLASFFWGFLNGSATPESITGPTPDSGAMTRWLFWLGFAAGCALFIAWLFF